MKRPLTVLGLILGTCLSPSRSWAAPSPTQVPAPRSATHAAEAHHPAASLEGDWAGSLQAGDAALHLVLHVSKGQDGSFSATIDSLDQGVYGIEVTSLAVKDSAIRFAVPSVGVSYEGKVLANFTGIEGVWSQEIGRAHV